MKGLWNVTTRTIDPGLVKLAILGTADALALIAVILAIFTRSRKSKVCQTLLAGFCILPLWLLCQLADLIVHHNRSTVEYRYILTDPAYNLLRRSSEFLILAGVFQLVLRAQRFRPRDKLLIAAWLSPAWACGLYHLSLRFASCVIWLELSDLEDIRSVVNAGYAFEVVYTSYYSLCIAGIAFRNFQASQVHGFHRINFLIGFLLLRSVGELITVAILYGGPKHLTNVYMARDILYGVLSTALAFAYLYLIQIDLPFLVNKRDYTDIVGNVQGTFNGQLQGVTENGRKTAPQMPELVALVKSSTVRGTAQHDEVKRVGRVYKRWQPIIKTSV